MLIYPSIKHLLFNQSGTRDLTKIVTIVYFILSIFNAEVEETIMSEDYRGMWKDMGLDLSGHDALLDVLGGAYRDIFLSQKNRPEGMGYFDFVMSEVHGLRIREILDEKKAGRKIIGSYCVFVPEEIVLAANATLVGLCSGADFALSLIHISEPTRPY